MGRGGTNASASGAMSARARSLDSHNCSVTDQKQQQGRFKASAVKGFDREARRRVRV
jgi:hypothetical protein